MGTRFGFQCGACGYSCMVSGGKLKLKRPQCGKPTLSRWVNPGPCPRCGYKNLEHIGPVEMWD